MPSTEKSARREDSSALRGRGMQSLSLGCTEQTIEFLAEFQSCRRDCSCSYRRDNVQRSASCHLRQKERPVKCTPFLGSRTWTRKQLSLPSRHHMHTTRSNSRCYGRALYFTYSALRSQCLSKAYTGVRLYRLWFCQDLFDVL